MNNVSDFLSKFSKVGGGGYSAARVLSALRDGSFEKDLWGVVEAEKAYVREWEFTSYRVDAVREAVRADLIKEMHADGKIEIQAIVAFTNVEAMG